MKAFLYRLLIGLTQPIVLLAFAIRSLKDRRYRLRWGERLGFLSSTLSRVKGGIIVHCASVGEVEAAKPLIEALLKTYPHTPITVTCTTPTGSDRIHKLFANRVTHCYLPIDTRGAVRRWLNTLQPRAILLLETELWPNLLIESRKANVQTFLINGRLSKKSARAYRRFYWFTHLILNHLDGLFAQDRATLKRFKALGFSNQAWLSGNLKFDLTLTQPAFSSAFSSEFSAALKSRLVWVAGSTHAGEDEQLIQAFIELYPQAAHLLLVLVPRHPERFEPVAQLLKQNGLRFQRLSEGQCLHAETQVLLGDTMGDLVRWYQAADWVFVGGSLIPRGGHNPLEAMIFGKPIMSGPHVFNFAQIYRQLENQHAIAWVKNKSDLITQATHWLSTNHDAEQAGQDAQKLFHQQTGATAKVIKQLCPKLGDDFGFQSHHMQTSTHVLFDRRFIERDAISNAFDPNYWQAQNTVIGSSQGRNQAWFICHQTHKMVLRHYYRGGLIGKLLNDQFLSQPALLSRAIQEFKLLSWMRAQGLPVPRPCAARYQGHGLFYQADILVELIADSQDLFHLLCQQPLTTQGWQQIGQMIAQFHTLGVYHSDLNCHNILIDASNQAWLIDFDKCERRKQGKWQQANLERLYRSLQKEKRLNLAFFFDASDWLAFTQSYYEQMQ